ncbi:MAG: trypsin-like peptidase domain-containing protein [Myxococcota bacterium]|nr:trypsin-like peptidase domain-containing protein [Myxococcota bacterium]
MMYRSVQAALIGVLMTVSGSMAFADDGVTGSSVTSAATAKKKKGVPACDKRRGVPDTSKNPGPAITQLRYVKPNGKLGAWASGSLISPHTVLTCGHCVFNRKKMTYNQRPMAIMPGAYKSNGNKLVMPYGEYRLTQVNKHKKTNKAYRTVKKRQGNYDYGAMLMICPFDHLQTYVPLAFKSPKSSVRVTGYPIESLPKSIQGGDQITGSGRVTEAVGRTMHYATRSTGGASGGPVFVFDAGSKTFRQVAVNTHHTTQCNGGGVTLKNRNRDLIVKWMKWKPSAAMLARMKCKRPKAVGWKALKKKYGRKGVKLMSAKQLKVRKKPAIPSPFAESSIYQYIEGTLYHWKEYRGVNKKRYLRLFAPTKSWLSVKEARILLTASSRWQKTEATAKKKRRKIAVKSVPLGDFKALEMPKLKPAKIADTLDSDDSE